ncbi:MAG TPA: DUF4258 domain-containing protein [Devosiaceae bacterium]|jgi:hypothetical protein|nr:DUF4258 domain-containing protein [Devosiaceae bacterium]
MPRRLLLTDHARTVIEERELDLEWVETTARSPEWEQADLTRPGIVRRFRAIPERDGRILRVALVETPQEIRIPSAFLDRRARKPE